MPSLSLAEATPQEERRWWRCTGCKATLGEVLDDGLIIAPKGSTGRYWIVPRPTGEDVYTAICRCGRTNLMMDLSRFDE